MKIELQATENIQAFDVHYGDSVLDGEITNRNPHGSGFCYRTDGREHLRADQLRALADELDRLNGVAL